MDMSSIFTARHAAEDGKQSVTIVLSNANKTLFSFTERVPDNLGSPESAIQALNQKWPKVGGAVKDQFEFAIEHAQTVSVDGNDLNAQQMKQVFSGLTDPSEKHIAQTYIGVPATLECDGAA